MKRKKVIILTITLIIALVIITLIINQAINAQSKSNVDVESEIVNEISNSNEIQETSENIIENTNIIQEDIIEDTQEELELSKESTIQEENIEEQKNITKNTQEKVMADFKQSEVKKETQTSENIATISKENQIQDTPKQALEETKTETNVQESYTPRCTDSKHGVGVGNSNKWFNSYNEAVSYYDNLIDSYSDQVHSGEITSEEYYQLCPYGYETWSCPYCEKWTLNYYKR